MTQIIESLQLDNNPKNKKLNNMTNKLLITKTDRKWKKDQQQKQPIFYRHG